MPAELTPAPSVTLTDDQRATFAAAGDVDAVLQAKIDEQARILRTDQLNARWNALTDNQKDAAIAAGQAATA